MITRPWITPSDVKSYTSNGQVKARTDDQLKTDIARAEAYITRYTHNDFQGDAYKDLETVPDDIRIADLILSEAYARNALVLSVDKKSETFDDYSYTTDTSQIDVGSLGLEPLLEPYMVPDSRHGVRFRMSVI